MNTNYQRVIPRDLFNEAKLLKCIGRLCLYIHDGNVPCEMTFSEPEEQFQIALMDEGALTITNVDFRINGHVYLFKTTYNSKANYPLFVQTDDGDIEVFGDTGDFTTDFYDFCRKEVKAGVDFWIKQFAPRKRQWQRDTLKRLRANNQTFGSLAETADKIEALKYILSA